MPALIRVSELTFVICQNQATWESMNMKICFNCIFIFMQIKTIFSLVFFHKDIQGLVHLLSALACIVRIETNGKVGLK